MIVTGEVKAGPTSVLVLIFSALLFCYSCVSLGKTPADSDQNKREESSQPLVRIAVNSFPQKIKTSQLASILTAEPETVEIHKALTLQEEWVFAGTAQNENDEDYGYYFKMRHQGKTLLAEVLLLNPKGQKLVSYTALRTDTEEKLSPLAPLKVGPAFLQFNPISNTWIFGFKNKHQVGFNFKVDMLKLAKQKPYVRTLRQGITNWITQTGGLTGHVQLGAESGEEFVTATRGWFRQLWLTKPQELPHDFRGILCTFHDGTALYSLKMQDEDAVIGASAGLKDTDGKPLAISQFISLFYRGKPIELRSHRASAGSKQLPLRSVGPESTELTRLKGLQLWELLALAPEIRKSLLSSYYQKNRKENLPTNILTRKKAWQIYLSEPSLVLNFRDPQIFFAKNAAPLLAGFIESEKVGFCVVDTEVFFLRQELKILKSPPSPKS